MLDIALLREDPEKVKKAIATKNSDPKLVDRFVALDEKWRVLTKEIDDLRSEQKKLGEKRDIAGAKEHKEKIKTKEAEMEELEKEREVIWLQIPNLPSEDVPIGKNEDENKVVRKVGEPRNFSGEDGFEPKDHVALGQSLGLIESEKAGVISGARFAYLMGDLVRLQFALVQHAFNVLGDEKILKGIAEKVRPGYSAKPFIPVMPPVMIKPDVFQRMARIEPKEERYYIPSDDVYLIGSAEHTLGPLHMDEVIATDALPMRYVGYSTSFRREAGSYGKDTKGILRLHQFDKIEMESFTLPGDGRDEQTFFVAIQEYLMQSLKLPYQVVAICTGDMGGPDVRQIDIETWMPGQNKYRETHTSDYMGDYQARRLGTKVRTHEGSTVFAHMNDATVFSGRPLIAIMENYQTKEGKIIVPEVLRPYVGKEVIG